MRKPDSILYWLDDAPPPRLALGLAIQQVAFLGALLAVPAFFARSVGLGTEGFLNLASATLLYGAVVLLLQVWARGRIGAGLFLPVQGTTAVFPAMLLAADTDAGLAASFGMVSVIGVSQMAFSALIPRLRGIFTVEVAGLAVLLVGAGIGLLGLELIFQPHGAAGAGMTGAEYADGATDRELFVAGLTFLTMVGLNVWVKGRLKLFATLCGLTAGLVASFALGLMGDSGHTLAEAPWLRLPHLMAFGWSWEGSVVAPYVLTGFALALTSMGVQTVAQRFNDADWRQPDLPAIGRGLRAEGAGHMVASLFNALPMVASGGAVSMAAASGCTSRWLGVWTAGALMVLALMPKVIIAWLVLPPPVSGALFLFLSCFATLSGVSLIGSRMLDNRKILAIGVGLLAGMAHTQVAPAVEASAPALHQVLFSSFSFGLLTAVALSALFRIGRHQRTRQRFPLADLDMDAVEAFLEAQGRLWGAQRDAVRRAEQATWQAVEAVSAYGLAYGFHPTLKIITRYDEFTFTVILRWQGELPPIPDSPPTADQLMEDPRGPLMMTGFLVAHMADGCRVRRTDSQAELRLQFKT